MLLAHSYHAWLGIQSPWPESTLPTDDAQSVDDLHRGHRRHHH
jgi:hypothetical protein